MTKKIFSVSTLLLLMHFLISCAIIGPNARLEESRVPTSLTIQAEKYPEVLLKEKAGTNKIVKLLKLEGGQVTYLPSPYWDVQPREIDLEQISSINLTGENRKGVAWFLGGALISFYLAGIYGLSTSTYNVDYEAAVGNSFMAAASGGLLGLAIGGVFNPRPRTKFNLSKMSPAEKVLALKNIMGAY